MSIKVIKEEHKNIFEFRVDVIVQNGGKVLSATIEKENDILYYIAIVEEE